MTWTTDFLDRVIQPEVSTADLVREHLAPEDQELAEALAPVLRTVRENVHFYGPPEEMAELEPDILRQLVAVFRASSRVGDRPRVHDLRHNGSGRRLRFGPHPPRSPAA